MKLETSGYTEPSAKCLVTSELVLFDALVRSSYHWASKFAVNKHIITEETSHLHSPFFFLECDENRRQVTGNTPLSFSSPIQCIAETTQVSRHCSIETQ